MQLLFVCHLVGPVLNRLNTERPKALLEVCICVCVCAICDVAGLCAGTGCLGAVPHVASSRHSTRWTDAVLGHDL